MTWQARAHDLTNYKTTTNGIRRHRRAVRGLRGAGAVVLAAGLLVAAVAPGMPHAAAAGVGPVTPPGAPITVVNQPLAAAGEAGLASWSFGAAGSAVAPSIVQAGTTGWLALTHGPAAVPAGGTTRQHGTGTPSSVNQSQLPASASSSPTPTRVAARWR